MRPFCAEFENQTKILNWRFKAAQLSLVNQKPIPNGWTPDRSHMPIWHQIRKPNEDFELKIQGRTTFISELKANS
jgi:hypothetical protein